MAIQLIQLHQNQLDFGVTTLYFHCPGLLLGFPIYSVEVMQSELSLLQF
ncbi:hypothetical protein LM800396_290034 [Listeria monocytogenes]|nr:hypothetical protein LM7420_10036 [Listeria monocytogenes]CUL38531.1 hypothetical protein LM7421_10036 [Listeria monocytogenes]CUL51486.1 hypothetical protein LM7456_10034 [Listeria monocytogenes]CUL65937.1 hypothetical protein LM800396_290034 [Listeria monocytogenes]